MPPLRDAGPERSADTGGVEPDAAPANPADVAPAEPGSVGDPAEPASGPTWFDCLVGIEWDDTRRVVPIDHFQRAPG